MTIQCAHCARLTSMDCGKHGTSLLFVSERVPGAMTVTVQGDDRIAADIEELGTVVAAFERMSVVGRDAALVYLSSRYPRNAR